MSVLDTLYLLFKSDSSDVKRGAEDAKKSSDGLERSLLSNKEAADALGKSFLGTIQNAQRNIAQLLTLGAITAKTLKESAEAEELGRFSERLNQNVEEVAIWGKLIQTTGGSAEGFRGTLEGLTNTLTEFSITGGGAAAETFARLGINAFDAGGKLKDAFTLLPEIADAFEGLSREESVNLGSKLGLDNATILLLQRGRNEIEALTQRQQRLGLITKEDTEIATQFNLAWRDTQTALGSLARNIGFSVLPILTTLQEKFQDIIILVLENESIIKDFFIALSPILVTVAAKAALALAPFLLLGAAITAAALAINDLRAYLNGYDSVIGRVLDSNQEAKESFDSFIDFIRKSFDYIKNNLFGDVYRELVDQINKILDLFGFELLEGGSKPLSSPEIERYERDLPPGHLIGLPDDLPPLHLLPDDQVNKLLEKAGIELNQANHNPLSSTPNSTISNQSNALNSQASVSINAININAPGADSTEIAQNIGERTESMMEYVIGNASTATLV